MRTTPTRRRARYSRRRLHTFTASRNACRSPRACRLIAFVDNKQRQANGEQVNKCPDRSAIVLKGHQITHHTFRHGATRVGRRYARAATTRVITTTKGNAFTPTTSRNVGVLDCHRRVSRQMMKCCRTKQEQDSGRLRCPLTINSIDDSVHPFPVLSGGESHFGNRG